MCFISAPLLLTTVLNQMRVVSADIKLNEMRGSERSDYEEELCSLR
jgi:hypothetical protein